MTTEFTFSKSGQLFLDSLSKEINLQQSLLKPRRDALDTVCTKLGYKSEVLLSESVVKVTAAAQVYWNARDFDHCTRIDLEQEVVYINATRALLKKLYCLLRNVDPKHEYILTLEQLMLYGF